MRLLPNLLQNILHLPFVLLLACGQVGSGKSSILNSVLGEMRVVHGFIQSSGSMAYAPQVHEQVSTLDACASSKKTLMFVNFLHAL